MESEEQPAAGPATDGTPPPRPQWVRWLLVALAVAILAVLVVMLVSGGDHGPGRHS